MTQFQQPWSGSTKALMYSSGSDDLPSWMSECTLLALEGIQVMSMAEKKRMAHFV
jgi:hypothetical protein